MLLKTILTFYEKSLAALQEDAPFSKLVSLPVREQIGRLKYVPENEVEARTDEILRQMNEQIRALTEGGERNA